MNSFLKWDHQVFEKINSGFPSDHLGPFALFLSAGSTWWGAALVALVFSLVFKKPELRKALLVGLLALGLTDAICAYLLKPTFQRERPCYQSQVKLRVPSCGSRNGMPSNHAANGAALLTAVSFFVSGLISAAIGLAVFLVGWSRIYLGVHFPLDVLMGYFVGILVGASLTKILIETVPYLKNRPKNAVTH